MSFFEAIASVLTGYVNFRGRACRSEYWWFFLFFFLASIVIAAIEVAMGIDPDVGPFSTIFGLAMVLPGLAVGVRRLHDIDRSGWWLLVWFVPLVGFIIVLVWACKRGSPEANRFGPDPLAPRGESPKTA